ncbi:MAG: LytTR family transcriptional regulator [Prevotella sp.]|nr:LytTR family transcriptional regulator [Prevotella sp.]
MSKKMKIVVTVPKEMEGLSVEMVIDENIKELMVQIVENNKVESTLHEEKPMHLLIKDRKCEHIIQINSIKWIKGDNQYCIIYMANRNLLVSKNMLAIQQLLPEGRFVRIHKSYIVNMDYATIRKGNFLYVDREPIPIGRGYKKNIK